MFQSFSYFSLKTTGVFSKANDIEEHHGTSVGERYSRVNGALWDAERIERKMDPAKTTFSLEETLPPT